jgi:E3 ubiquitin-protein ligase HERC3
MLDDGALKCWGDNSIGQLGYGDTVRRGRQAGEMGDNLPAVNLGAGRRAVAVTTGGKQGFQPHTCALLDNGAVKCWGGNANGQLGLGNTTPLSAPGADVSLGTGRTAIAIAAADNYTCAVLDNGSVKCWGWTWLGEFGNQPGEMGDALPALTLGTGRTAVAITGGIMHHCVRLDNADLKCWGYNFYGQLGLGDNVNRAQPGNAVSLGQ